jgi:hypothetical protein
MSIKLNGLAVGQWRDLAQEELSELVQVLENVSSDVSPAI